MSRPRLEDTACRWPEIHLASWAENAATVHMWTHIVVKIRMALTPPLNHFWHVPLYVSTRGLRTSTIPYGRLDFEIEFDFLDEALAIRRCDGVVKSMRLYPRSVADFYRELMAVLRSL